MNEHRPIRLPPPGLTDEEKEKYEAIEEAIRSLARDGLIVDTGHRRWSKRTGTYRIVWAAAPGVKLE